MPANWMREPYWSDQKYGGLGRRCPGRPAGEQRGDRDGRPLQRAGPVLDAVRPADARPRARPHSRPTATTFGIDVAPPSSHTTPSANSSGLSRSHSMLGTRADADHDDVGGQLTPVGQLHAGDPVAARKAGDADPAQQPGAVVGVQPGDDGAELLAERAGQRCRRGLDDRHVQAQFPLRSRRLRRR